MADEMEKTRTILVTVDSAEYSGKIVEQAVQVAKERNARLVALSVVELYPEAIARAPNLEEDLAHAAHEILETVREQAVAAGIECDTIVHIGGRAYEFVINEAEKNAVELIVMGSHGRSQLHHLLVGSVTERVVGHTKCPVLVVPVRKA